MPRHPELTEEEIAARDVRKREQNRERMQRYRENNREKVNAEARAYKALHKERDRERNIEACRRWRAANRDELESRRRLRRQDPEVHERILARESAYHHAHKDQRNASRKENLQAARITSPWTKFFHSAQQRAKKKNVPFDLTPEWVQARWTGRCEITDIPFSTAKTTRGPGFFSPSLDRVVPEHGYVQTNCRFVLWAVNAMKSEGTDEDMMIVARALVARFHQ